MSADAGRALDLPALAEYLRGVGVPVTGALSATRLTGGKSNLTFAVTDEDGDRWVIRRPPMAGLTPSAHDMGREHRITAALAGTAVPVAPALALCEDPAVIGAPFSVAGFVDGAVVRTRTDLEALSDGQVDACVGEMVRVLAALHALDPDAVGLGDFGRPAGYLERQVSRWRRQWGHVGDAEAVPDVARLGAALAEQVPAESGAAIVHGDYRIDNVMLAPGDPGRILAVVDWELSALGDPLADVAMMCVYRDRILDRVLGMPAAWSDDRIPTPGALAERYARAAGTDLPRWEFYLALAYFKIAVISAGIAHRARAGADAGADDAAGAVSEYAAAGLAALARAGR